MSTQWTSERVEELARLWTEGHSAREIAEALGDVSRNAVIGKAHRLNLQRGTETLVKRVEPPPPPVIVYPRVKPASETKSWMCRWPSEKPGRFGLHICGKTAQPGREFCAEHLTAAYLMRRRAAA